MFFLLLKAESKCTTVHDYGQPNTTYTLVYIKADLGAILESEFQVITTKRVWKIKLYFSIAATFDLLFWQIL